MAAVVPSQPLPTSSAVNKAMQPNWEAMAMARTLMFVESKTLLARSCYPDTGRFRFPFPQFSSYRSIHWHIPQRGMDRHMVSAGSSAADLPFGEVLCKGQHRLLSLLCSSCQTCEQHVFKVHVSIQSDARQMPIQQDKEHLEENEMNHTSNKCLQ